MDEKTTRQMFVAELSAHPPADPYADLWKDARCAICGHPFTTETQWENRHWSDNGSFCENEELHPGCCPECMRDGHPALYGIIMDALERAMGIMTPQQQAEWDADGLLDSLRLAATTDE